MFPMNTSPASPVFVIAEAGVNHNGKLALAKRLVDVAANAGADAVKFQAFSAGSLVTKTAPRARYQRRNAPGNDSQFSMLKKLELDVHAFRTLVAHCAQRRINFLATPFDTENLDMLVESLNAPALKISSGDLNNGPLLLHAARRGRPVFLSTGMSNLADIEEALGILAFGYTNRRNKPTSAMFRRAYGSGDGRQALMERVILLHCTSEYPAPMHDVNLRAIATLKCAFGLPVGFSDHTNGIEAAIAAAALGAVVIEKHFTLDRTLLGPDHIASIEPDELKEMIRAIRNVTAALGTPIKHAVQREEATARAARKSLVALRLIRVGERFSTLNLGIKRPGTGVSPAKYWEYLGCRSTREYLTEDTIEP